VKSHIVFDRFKQILMDFTKMLGLKLRKWILAKFGRKPHAKKGYLDLRFCHRNEMLLHKYIADNMFLCIIYLIPDIIKVAKPQFPWKTCLNMRNPLKTIRSKCALFVLMVFIRFWQNNIIFYRFYGSHLPSNRWFR
jgi:hypothetical protein